MEFKSDRDFAAGLDGQDELREFRDHFYIPQKEGQPIKYFTGHSLGPQPKSPEEYTRSELTDWASLGVEGHFKGGNPWVNYHKIFEGPLSRLTGAKEHEVVAMNSLSVNLHLMLSSFYRPDKKRWKIIVEGDAFSSDMYALESQCRLHGLDPEKAVVEIFPCADSEIICTGDLLEAIDKNKHELALVFLGGVNYYTGQVVDMATIAKAVHNTGAKVGFDLAHAIGNIPLQLHEWEVDFAVWCSYKYLNSGPGGTGGAFIHERYSLDENMPRLAGWWGHNEKERFLMKKGFLPEPGASGWQLSNANIFSLAIQKASLDIFDKAGIDRIRKKSLQLTGYLEFLLKEHLPDGDKKFSLRIITPSNPEERGAQLSIKVNRDARELTDLLLENNFSVDFRSPDVIRIAPAPLYNTFEEVWLLVDFMKNHCRYER